MKKEKTRYSIGWRCIHCCKERFKRYDAV